MHEVREACGVFGIRTPEKEEVARSVCAGLTALQHRGQESAGIAVNEDRLIRCTKGMGLVQDVFSEAECRKLGSGCIAVGHVRYSTSGISEPLNAQPMVVKHVKGQLALCHNGNLTNSFELRRELELEGCIFHTTSDTEAIAYRMIRERLSAPSIEDALNRAMYRLEGAYSLVMMSPAKLIACRDEYGFRPLVMGKRADGAVVFASETCALDAVGACPVRDLEPGEIVVADQDGIRSIRDHCGRKKRSFCIFEYIYFSRTDSVLEGVPVQEYRKRAGACLAKEHAVEADVVIGVPDSGLDAALGYAEESGIPFALGLSKNKYIGRTFIAPEQGQRESLVRMKLNPVRSAVEGRRVVLIDNSLVRGTTSARIVGLLKSAGAKEVHVRISSPPFLNPCYYGTDVDTRENLIACMHTQEEICRLIGADSLGFLPVAKARTLIPGQDGFCSACFDGAYPTAAPVQAEKNRFEW